ncbi:MAG: hypothetical protein GY906_25825 [bacterium]|nr:hypothetical protein [bacterium]
MANPYQKITGALGGGRGAKRFTRKKTGKRGVYGKDWKNPRSAAGRRRSRRRR